MRKYIKIKNLTTNKFLQSYETIPRYYKYTNTGREFNNENSVIKYLSCKKELNANHELIKYTIHDEKSDISFSEILRRSKIITKILDEYSKTMSSTKQKIYTLDNLRNILMTLNDKGKLDEIKYILCINIDNILTAEISDNKSIIKTIREKLKIVGINSRNYNISGNAIIFFNDNDALVAKLKFDVLFQTSYNSIIDKIEGKIS